MMQEVLPQFTFRIDGNQEDPAGNAIPKIKKTAAQQWTPEAQRYQAWKQYVRSQFFRGFKGGPVGKQYVQGVHPLDIGDDHAHMELVIGWGKENHADPESVFGSIADALFKNDKHLSAAIAFLHTPDRRGYVEVKIWIYPSDVVAPVKKRSKIKRDAG